MLIFIANICIILPLPLLHVVEFDSSVKLAEKEDDN